MYNVSVYVTGSHDRRHGLIFLWAQWASLLLLRFTDAARETGPGQGPAKHGLAQLHPPRLACVT